MQVEQLLMLVAEAAVMAVVVIGLFRARTVLGLTPLYIVLGGLQYLEATISLRAEIIPGFPLYPASTVMFPATLVSVLLIYVKEDAPEARKLVYGLVLANAVAAIVAMLIGWHMQLPGTVAPNLRAQDFLGSAWISAVGTSLLFLDVIGIILFYEFFSRYTRGLFTPFFLSFLTIVAFDNLLFMAMVHSQRPNALRLVVAGFAGKAVAAFFYSVLAWLYLKYFEPRTAVVGTGLVSDVFQRLTYRQKYEQVRQRMVRDALTGLFNRGYLDEALPQAMAHAERTGEPLSLLVVDVDRFKQINDSLSHIEGDHALQLIARTLSDETRSGDVPCRFGGDEFVLLLPKSDSAAAGAFAERFRDKLATECRTANPPHPWGIVSTTIGIATYPLDSEIRTPEDMLRVADKRLYEGKQGGRDRIVRARAAATV